MDPDELYRLYEAEARRQQNEPPPRLKPVTDEERGQFKQKYKKIRDGLLSEMKKKRKTRRKSLYAIHKKKRKWFLEL